MLYDCVRLIICHSIHQALLTLTQLERLDLMDTHFGEAGGRVLARAIAQQVVLCQCHWDTPGLSTSNLVFFVCHTQNIISPRLFVAEPDLLELTRRGNRGPGGFGSAQRPARGLQGTALPRPLRWALYYTLFLD